MRRYVLKKHIARRGGRYITPKQNHLTDPALWITSIHLDDMTGIGATEAVEQSDWFRQSASKAAGLAVAA